MHSILRRPRRALGRHLQTRTRGQSLVEFALILPIFLMFVAAALDLGRVIYANITLSNAAREGAMYAAQEPGLFVENADCDPVTNNVVCRIQFESQDSMVEVAATDIDMTCSMTGCPGQAGSLVTIEVRGSFSLVTPLLSAVFGGTTLGLTSRATAQVEYFPDPSTATPPPGPVADFVADVTSIVEGDAVTFDSSGSTGDPTAWNWDFDGDGTVDSVEENPTFDYVTAGTFTVTLTVINATSVNTKVRTGYIVVAPGSGGPPPSAPPPSCTNPPNVIGIAPGTAQADLINAGFAVTSAGDLTSGQKNKVQAQNPDHTQCLDAGTTITIHWRPA